MYNEDDMYFAWSQGRKDRETQNFKPEQFAKGSEEQTNYELGYEGIAWDLQDYDLEV